MGTNYYLETDHCPCCGRPKQVLHIGKNSAGWRFCFDGQDLKSFDIEEIKKQLKNGNIKDEYGEEISYNDFFKMIRRKCNESDCEISKVTFE